MFWLICLLLSAMVAATVTRPLWSPAAPGPDGSGARALFDGQTAEIEADLSAGRIDKAEADARKATIARRLIAATRAAQSGAAERSGRPLALAAALLLPLGALGGYWMLGAKGLPDAPLKARIEMAERARAERPSQAEMRAMLPERPAPEADAEYLALVEQLRAAVAANPEDIQGLELLVRQESALGNLPAAIAAQEQIAALRGTPADKLRVIDLMTFETQNYVSPEAEARARALLAEEPGSTGAQYYLGLMYFQTGRPDLAFAAWRDLPQRNDSQYAELAGLGLPEAAMRAGIPFEAPPAPEAPSQEEAMAAGRAMTEQLAARLASEGGPAEDWARLIRALRVLGEEEQAARIRAEAETRFAEDPAALALIAEAGR